jgi:hypothetical protein
VSRLVAFCVEANLILLVTYRVIGVGTAPQIKQCFLSGFALATQLTGLYASSIPELPFRTITVGLPEVMSADLAWFGTSMLEYMISVASLL